MERWHISCKSMDAATVQCVRHEHRRTPGNGYTQPAKTQAHQEIPLHGSTTMRNKTVKILALAILCSVFNVSHAGMPGMRGTQHISFTDPNLDKAITWFE